MNFTAALRISNCRGSLASLPRLQCSLVPKGTRKCVHLRLKIYIKVHKAQIEQKRNVVVVVVVVIVIVVVVAIFAISGTMS